MKAQRRTLFPSLLTTGMVFTALAVALVAGCADKGAVCKDPYATMAQRCVACKPWDYEVLARINPTEIPYPVRDTIVSCADSLRPKSDKDPDKNVKFVTQEDLIDCVGRDPQIDAETKNILAGWVRESNLMKRVDQSAQVAICSAGEPIAGSLVPPASDSLSPLPAAPIVPPPAAPTVPPPPPQSIEDSLLTPMAPAAAPAPVAPAAPAMPARPSPPLRPAGPYRP